MKKHLRCIRTSTPSCALLIAFRLPFVVAQLKFLKSTHGSTFQCIRACMLIVAIRHASELHSGAGERVGKQLKSVFELQSFGSCDGAVLNKNRTGEATNSDVTRSVAAVRAILCTVADVRSHTQGMQHIQLAVI